jgi:hypothetical protein
MLTQTPLCVQRVEYDIGFNTGPSSETNAKRPADYEGARNPYRMVMSLVTNTTI